MSKATTRNILPLGEEVHLYEYIEKLKDGEDYVEERLFNCINIIYQSICPGNRDDVLIFISDNLRKIIISNRYCSTNLNYLSVFLDYHLSTNNKSYIELGEEYIGASYLRPVLTSVIEMFKNEMESEYSYRTELNEKRIKYFQLKDKKDKTDEEIKKMYYLARDVGIIDFFTGYEEFLIENNFKEKKQNGK